MSGTLCSLATQAHEVPSLVAAGALAPIVAMLRDGSHGAQERALVALEKLTEAGGGGERAAGGAGALSPRVTGRRAGPPPGRTDSSGALDDAPRFARPVCEISNSQPTSMGPASASQPQCVRVHRDAPPRRHRSIHAASSSSSSVA